MTKLAIGDADCLVALADPDDANHKRAEKISTWLANHKYEVIFPNTAILEAITALKRAKNLPDKANLVSKKYRQGDFLVEYVSLKIQDRASARFEKTVSKKNTIFDAIVIEISRELRAEYIFSFDEWYLKEGFKLAPGYL